MGSHVARIEIWTKFNVKEEHFHAHRFHFMLSGHTLNFPSAKQYCASRGPKSSIFSKFFCVFLMRRNIHRIGRAAPPQAVTIGCDMVATMGYTEMLPSIARQEGQKWGYHAQYQNFQAGGSGRAAVKHRVVPESDCVNICHPCSAKIADGKFLTE